MSGERPWSRTVRAGRVAGAVVIAIAFVGVAFWAGRVTVGSPVVGSADVDSVTHTVSQASVGRSLSLNVTVEQPFAPVATNVLAGTVTDVVHPDPVEVGDVLYEVDTVPVRALAGATPFWRSLSSGVDGDDVAQLQRALSDLGHYSGEVDGRFRWTTTEAVRSWQDELGLTPTGVVEHGELVAVPTLPAALLLADEIAVGAQIAGGEAAVQAATGQIEFALVVSDSQAAMMPAEASVLVEHDDHSWQAVAGESTRDEGGNVRFELSAPDGGQPCGDDCDKLPAAERTTLSAQVTVEPEVSGPAVPSAAVHTDADGTAWVQLADGERREVSVRGSSQGIAVVDGLTPGERVQVLGEPDDVDPAAVDGGAGSGGDGAGAGG